MALPVLVKEAVPGLFQLLMNVDLQYCYDTKVSVLVSAYAVNVKTATHISHTSLDS